MKDIVSNSDYKEYRIGEYKLWTFEKPIYINSVRGQCLTCSGKSENSKWHNCYIWKKQGEIGSYKGVFCIDCTTRYNFDSDNIKKIKSEIALLRMKEII